MQAVTLPRALGRSVRASRVFPVWIADRAEVGEKECLSEIVRMQALRVATRYATARERPVEVTQVELHRRECLCYQAANNKP